MKRVYALVLWLWVVLAGALPSSAEEVRLSLPEGRTLAARLLEAGRPQEALALVEGILSGKPDDVPAMILKSRALRDLGNPDQARVLARQAWNSASLEEDKFFAALVMAQARASNGQNGLGQIWLRRASQVAPNDSLKQLARRDFRQLRRLTPWRLLLDLRTERDNNINNAPKSDGFSHIGLEPVRLEGLRARATGRFIYSLPVAERSRLHFNLTAGLARVKALGDEWDAVSKTPEDYREEQLGFGLRHDWISPSGKGITELGGSANRYWYGGLSSVDSTQIWLSHRRNLKGGVTLDGTVRRSGLARHYADNGNSVTHAVGLGFGKRFEHFRLGLHLDVSKTDAKADVLANTQRRATLSLASQKAHFGMQPKLRLSYIDTDYVGGTALTSTAGPRKDNQWLLAVDVTFPELDYFGFAPTVGVSFSDRESNYVLYSNRSTDLRIGLKSVF